MNTISHRQTGVALVLSLLLLVVLLIIGIVVANNALMQERLAGNFRDSSVAFQASEASARWSMAWLQSLGAGGQNRPFPCEADCSNSSRVWMVGQYPDNPEPSDDLWEAARAYGINPSDDSAFETPYSLPMVGSQPKFIIEQQYFARDDLAGAPHKGVAYYRVTALGKGARPVSNAMVRAVLAKRFE